MLVALALLIACRTTGAVPAAQQPGPPELVDTGHLVPTQEIKGGFSLSQRIEAFYDNKTVPPIDAVLQLHGGVLQLVALTPFGTRALVIRQTGTEVTVEKFIDKLPPLDPEAILRDIHRVLFRGLFIGKPAPADGIHTGRDGEDLVVESWRGGRLHERTFRPQADEVGPPAVRIGFLGEGEVVAKSVRLEHLRLGYQLVITTFEQQVLPP